MLPRLTQLLACVITGLVSSSVLYVPNPLVRALFFAGAFLLFAAGIAANVLHENAVGARVVGLSVEARTALVNSSLNIEPALLIAIARARDGDVPIGLIVDFHRAMRNSPEKFVEWLHTLADPSTTYAVRYCPDVTKK
jgi:hypothetical protein